MPSRKRRSRSAARAAKEEPPADVDGGCSGLGSSCDYQRIHRPEALTPKDLKQLNLCDAHAEEIARRRRKKR